MRIAKNTKNVFEFIILAHYYSPRCHVLHSSHQIWKLRDPRGDENRFPDWFSLMVLHFALVLLKYTAMNFALLHSTLLYTL